MSSGCGIKLLMSHHQRCNMCVQKGLAVVLSLVYGTINGHTSFGIFAMMMDISRTSEVAAFSTLGMGLRCASAAGLTLGSLLFGARIVPVTGKLPNPIPTLCSPSPLDYILGKRPDTQLSSTLAV